MGRQSRTSGSETGEQGGRLHLVVAAPASSAPPVLELRGEFDLDTVPQIDRFLRRNPQIAQDYLLTKNRVVGIYLPKNEGEKTQ